MGKRERNIFGWIKTFSARITKNEENKELYAKANEAELARTLKQMIAKKNYDDFNFDFSITDFMQLLGLSYKILQKVKKKKYLIWNLPMTIGKKIRDII